MGVRNNRNNERNTHKRWIVSIIVAILAFVVPVIYTSYISRQRNLIISNLTADINYGNMTRITFFEVNNEVGCYDSLGNGLVLILHNANDFSVPVQNIFIDVVSFQPYDSYLRFLHVAGVSDMQTFTCNITSKLGRYVAQYSPDFFDQDNTNSDLKYLKISPKDSEEAYILLDADTEGIYGIRIAIEYSLQGKTLVESTDSIFYFSKDPINTDFVNHAIYFVDDIDSTEAFFDLCPNGIKTLEEIDTFLDTHYEQPELYRPHVKGLFQDIIEE